MRKLAIGLLLGAARLSAQTSNDPTGAIFGVIKDRDQHPVPNVEIVLVTTNKSVRSDSAGEFLIANVPVGRTGILFRRLAYSPVVYNAVVVANDTTEIAVTLRVIAQSLAAVVIDASADRRNVMGGFEARRKRGIGHFITREEIDRRDPVLMSDMARAFPGVTIMRDQRSGMSSIHFGRSTRTDCPPQYIVDGVPAYSFNLDDMQPDAVEAVELYPGGNGVPPEFNRAITNVACGVIAIWSRLPPPLRRKKP